MKLTERRVPDPWSYAATGREHSHQTALFMWANMAFQFGLTAADNPDSYKVSGVANTLLHRHVDRVIELEWLHAIHNQGPTPGKAGMIRGAIAKAEGVKAGVFDIFLPFPVDGAHGLRAGLYIEMKKLLGGKPSAEQKLFAEYAERVGYVAKFAVGWLEARTIILTYLQKGG
jgi:hypothetical protein